MTGVEWFGPKAANFFHRGTGRCDARLTLLENTLLITNFTPMTCMQVLTFRSQNKTFLIRYYAL